MYTDTHVYFILPGASALLRDNYQYEMQVLLFNIPPPVFTARSVPCFRASSY